MASIRERNGKFNVIYSYTNEKGERKQKWETYETKAEAKRRKKEIEYKCYLPMIFLLKWLERLKYSICDVFIGKY